MSAHFQKKNVKYVSFAPVKAELSKAARREVIERHRAMASGPQGWSFVPNAGPAAVMGRYATNGAELKSFDAVPNFSVSGAVPGSVLGVSGSEPSNPTFTGMMELNDVQVGTAFYQRVGSKISPVNLDIEFDLFCGAEGAQQTIIRYMIIYDRQPNGAFPAIGDILATNSGAPGPYSGVNIQNRSRFHVFRDREIRLDSASTLCQHCKEFIKLQGLNMEYKASGASIGDISSGSILFIAFQGTTLDGTNPSIDGFKSRLRYLD